MRSAVLAFVVLGVVACGAGKPGPASAATMNASTANLSSVFNSAQPGDTILLAGGDYGNFSGGAKSGTVTLKPQAGATASIHPVFNGASNVTLDGMTIQGAEIGGKSHDIAIVNSRFTGMTAVDASTMTNANITFDHDTFDGIDACSNCYEGRLTVRGNNNTAPVGVKVTNSHFGNSGGSDGVQVVGDAYGVQIGPGNEFSGIRQGNYTAHVDSIQLYGSSHTQIIGNYFHDDDTIIMAPDGGDHEYIANNVMIGGGYVPAVQLGSHDGTQFVHKTVKSISVHADAKSSSNPSRNVVVSDNVFGPGADTNANDGLCTNCTVSYNLFTSGGVKGNNNLVGTPKFAGGASPTTFAGWALADGSPGKGNASDGTDRGINPNAFGAGPNSGAAGATTPPAPAAPAGSASSTPALTTVAAVTPRLRWSFRPSRPTTRTRIILSAPKGTEKGAKCLWFVSKNRTRRGCRISVRYPKAGVKHIKLRITHKDGSIQRGERTIRVVRPKKHR
jgi:hypothetical protein